jgi:hypothetical protein
VGLAALDGLLGCMFIIVLVYKPEVDACCSKVTTLKKSASHHGRDSRTTGMINHCNVGHLDRIIL